MSGAGAGLDAVADPGGPGLQAERTALAWERTGLGVVGVGALLAHLAAGDHAAAQEALGAAVMGVGAVLGLVLAPLRYRAVVAADERGVDPLPAAGTALVSAAVVGIGAVAVALLVGR